MYTFTRIDLQKQVVHHVLSQTNKKNPAGLVYRFSGYPSALCKGLLTVYIGRVYADKPAREIRKNMLAN